MELKLGRLAGKPLPAGTRKLTALRLTQPPLLTNRRSSVKSWPVLKNAGPGACGDCTIAAAGHIIQLWNAVMKNNIETMTEEQALAVYEKLSGYVPGNPATDTGLYESDVLSFWQERGMPSGPATIKLNEFLSVPPESTTQIEQAVSDLGACYFCLHLPESALQTKKWYIVSGSPIAGGHAVPIVDYDRAEREFYIISWGKVVPMTYNFAVKYGDAAAACYSYDWIKAVS